MASALPVTVSVPITFLHRCLPGLSTVCVAILFVAAFLHWQRTRHWSLLVLATGSLLIGLCTLSTLALLSGWWEALGAPGWFFTSLVRIMPWLAACAHVIGAVGGIGAIHWAIRLRQRPTSVAANTGQPQRPPSADQPGG